MRYIPRSSVTLVNVLPEAAFVAVTVTPGRTPPVLSLTVPLNVASCAYARIGNASNATVSRTNRPNFIRASLCKATWSKTPDYIHPGNTVVMGLSCLSVREKTDDIGRKQMKTMKAWVLGDPGQLSL